MVDLSVGERSTESSAARPDVTRRSRLQPPDNGGRERRPGTSMSWRPSRLVDRRKFRLVVGRRREPPSHRPKMFLGSVAEDGFDCLTRRNVVSGARVDVHRLHDTELFDKDFERTRSSDAVTHALFPNTFLTRSSAALPSHPLSIPALASQTAARERAARRRAWILTDLFRDQILWRTDPSVRHLSTGGALPNPKRSLTLDRARS